ncbi:2718_t:CDS:1, partial [Racocetra fulgida]
HQQQFYSNADIDRLVEERIVSREKQSLKPKQISQVDPNTEAVRQFIEIIKQAKKTLAKKPGPGKEKADKIHIDCFLDDLAKDNPDYNS